jgi:DNA-directed RNA polymerase III subunit RPC3
VIGGRIFRLLLIKKQLEEKQVTQFTMLPPSESRSLLFRLFQDGLLQMQEVPKTQDHHPSRTFYLWNVNLTVVYEKLIEDMFKTVLNLRMRHSNERNKVLTKIGGDVSNISSTLSSEQNSLLERFGKIEIRLEYSILHLMKLIMQFEEFVSS